MTVAWRSAALVVPFVLAASHGVHAAPALPNKSPSVKECVTAAERGQREREKLVLRSARDAFIACSHDKCPSAVRVECASWLADVERRLPSIVVNATDEQHHDIADASVYVDGVMVREKTDGTRIELDPGPHKLRVVRAGAAAVNLDVVAHEGEKNRLVDVILPAAPPSVPAPSPETKPATDLAAPALAPQPRRDPFPILPVALAGAGVVSIGLFAFFAATGQSDVDDLRATCAPRCNDSDVSDARTKIVVANLALGVGAVALAAAGVVFFTTRGSSSTTTVAASSSGGLIVRKTF